jgi:hypothetical protein
MNALVAYTLTASFPKTKEVTKEAQTLLLWSKLSRIMIWKQSLQQMTAGSTGAQIQINNSLHNQSKIQLYSNVGFQ